MQTQRPVPASRISRLVQLGRLGSGIAGAVVAEGLRQIGKGNRPAAPELLLTPANARRLADRLSEMRGAAMKVGQLLSMEAGDILPDPLPEILSRLRDQAHAMPLGQVAGVLDEAWGADWKSKFRRFHFTPIAAASIGQVHEAETKDGRHLAIKIQYPGVARSIDSDLNNVLALFRMFRLLPPGLEIEPLLEVAQRQLHAEADYLAEADHLRSYAACLGSQPGLRVPEVADDLTTPTVLAMEYVDGEPIETLASAPRETRERVAVRITELALRELFDWRLVQTDPNFANFRYRAEGDEIVLLDFGATRRFNPELVEAFRVLIDASLGADDNELERAAIDVGYLATDDVPDYRRAVVDMVSIAAEPAKVPGLYHFGNADLSDRLSQHVMRMHTEQNFSRLPPPDVLYIHRKLGGLYLLLKRLNARVSISELIAPYISRRE
jgi:predicted unusual protein kinase regulating ubiquinone biosynthesis (AarF/ABC1/UbiB family)